MPAAEGNTLQETRLRENPEGAGNRASQPRFSPDSVGWLILVSALFFAAQMLPALLRLPLGTDEITYIARTSLHQSGVMLPPVHGHAAGLLAAPVTLFTTSLLALRIWMALLSAVGLLLSLLCWRGLRPTWVLALGGFIFASLAITQLSGVQVYPDLWAAYAALAITGLLLQAVDQRMRLQVVLPLIAFLAFFIVLLRPQNIVFVLAPTFAAPLVVRGWRQPRILVAMLLGTALGLLEWAAEAYLWFGGLFHRIHLARQEPPTFAPHFSPVMQAKVLSGPWYCQDNHICPDWNFPLFILWWIALIGLVVLGLYAVWHTTAKASAVLAVVTGLWSAVLYIVFVPFGAPRYMLPTWALFAMVAADGIVWLATVPKWRRIGAAAACGFLLIGVITQHLVIIRETAHETTIRAFASKARILRNDGIRPPCVIFSPAVAYYVGCSAPWTGATIDQILNRDGGVKQWHEIHPPGPIQSVWVRG